MKITYLAALYKEQEILKMSLLSSDFYNNIFNLQISLFKHQHPYTLLNILYSSKVDQFFYYKIQLYLDKIIYFDSFYNTLIKVYYQKHTLNYTLIYIYI